MVKRSVRADAWEYADALSSVTDGVADMSSEPTPSFVGEAFAKASNSSVTATEMGLNSGMTSRVRFAFNVREWDEWGDDKNA